MIDNGACSYRRFLEGDKDGILEIIKEYKDGLILYINSIVGNIFVAEELMEDTFVKIIVKKPNYGEKSSFKTWLYSLGKNCAYDYLRHTSKYSDKAIESYENQLQAEEDLERSYIIQERKVIVHRALGKLDSNYRQVIYLIYFEDFTNEQAAKVMNKSKRQIEQLLCRAKLALKKELTKEGFVYEEF